VAVLAVDMNANNLKKLTLGSFSPFLYFIGIFVLFVIIRFAAFNRSFFKELRDTFHLGKVGAAILIFASISGLITFGTYRYLVHRALSRLQEGAISIAVDNAKLIDPIEVHGLHFPDDIHNSTYINLVTILNGIRDRND